MGNKVKEAQINGLPASAEKVYYALSVKKPMIEHEVIMELESIGVHMSTNSLRKLLMDLVDKGVVKRMSKNRAGKFEAAFLRKEVIKRKKCPVRAIKTNEEADMSQKAQVTEQGEVTVDTIIESLSDSVDATKAALEGVGECMVELSIALDKERAKIADLEQLRDVLSRLK